MVLRDDCACFMVSERLKGSKARSPPQEVHLPKYTKHESLCVHRCLRTYLRRTKPLRGKVRSLFLITRKPHTAAKRDTVRGWIKSVMKKAGINVNLYKCHSTRSASTSKAAHSLPLGSIMKAAGWASASSFANHYKKPLENHDSFANAVLSRARVSHR